jgi:hypothetical protein
MLLGAHSLGTSDQVLQLSLPCIHQFLILQLKNQPSDQGLNSKPELRFLRQLNFLTLKVVFCNLCDIDLLFHSILSKNGVHGFPTLFLLNSTVRVRYRGSRSLGSLVAFYSDVTGKVILF